MSETEKIGKYHPDLIARKGDEVVVVEVKAGKLTPQKRRQVAEIGDFVRTRKNYKFLVVLATPPKSKKIDIPNLEKLLLTYLLNEYKPNALDELSSQIRITDISDATVHELTVHEDGSIAVKGSGTIEVELIYGPTTDKTQVDDVFPFSFEATLNHNQQQELFLAAVKTIAIDTSAFYE